MPVFGLYLLIGFILFVAIVGFIIEWKIDKHNLESKK
jgi:hypothetical protein